MATVDGENFADYKSLIDQSLTDYLEQSFWSWCQENYGTQEVHPEIKKLAASMEYSCVRGGKRFRPLLGLLFAEAFGVGPPSVLPWIMAVEMVHTYSLIHDDLPCMDDDDLRRGEPTNHKAFGESMALLAGDSLVTEAFVVLAKGYRDKPEIAVALVEALGAAAGFRGMVSGQAIDMSVEPPKDWAELKMMHSLKTGALIAVSVEGAAIAIGLPAPKRALALQFGQSLGLAFQLKDDLLDNEFKNLAIEEYLAAESLKAKESLNSLGIPQGPLWNLVEYNLQRGH